MSGKSVLLALLVFVTGVVSGWLLGQAEEHEDVLQESPSCEPLLCGALEPLQCGIHDDGCGGTLNCGLCNEEELQPVEAENSMASSDGETGLHDLPTSRPSEGREVIEPFFVQGDGTEPAVGDQPDGEIEAAIIPTRLPQGPLLREGCWAGPDASGSGVVNVNTEIFLEAGDIAPDFVLMDIDGRAVHLYEQLAESPVLIQFGSYTCPIYQGHIRQTDRIAEHFSDVEFWVVYVPEAHPVGEGSPYSGNIAPPDRSELPHARTYNERVAHARQLELGPLQTLLIDDMSPRRMNNPVWCTYGTAPNSAFLINQEGRVEAAHRWFDPQTMVRSIDAMLGLPPRDRGENRRRGDSRSESRRRTDRPPR